MFDEINAWPQDIEGEGDPLAILEEAMSTFPNRKEFVLSTPTIKGQSKIEAEYENSSRGKWNVPCPFCGAMQILMFKNLIFDAVKPTKAEYQCEHCQKMISEKYKEAMNAAGVWIHENPNADAFGYWLNGIYSPWKTWLEIAKQWMKANRALKMQKTNFLLKQFINQVLAEEWNENDEDAIDRETLYGQLIARREEYPDNIIPMNAPLVVIAGDVQDDRIELIVKAFGPGMQSWSVLHHILYGNPAVAGVWEKCEQFIGQTWRHESGAILSPHIIFIDSGYLSKQVYEFTKPRFDLRVFSTKGSNEPKHELISRLSRKNAERCPLFFIGTNEAKNILFRRLVVTEPGPAYMHFNKSFDENYLKQVVLSERTKWHKGVKIWEKVTAKEPNEGLDLECLALASAELYVRTTGLDLAAEVERLKIEGEKIKPEEPEEEAEAQERQQPGWVTSITGGKWGLQ
jgi:phage terminase large subunit GpA-like protein